MSKREIHGQFLAYVETKSLDATSLALYINDLLNCFDLDSLRCRPSVMSGRCAGVQAIIRDFAPNASYIHCDAHVKNLVLVDSCGSVFSASEFFSLLTCVHGIFEGTCCIC